MRPTAVRARKALFDALAHRTELRETFLTGGDSLVLLDVYAGVGALGLEALSRWGGRGIFVEGDEGVATVLRVNMEKSGLAASFGGRVFCFDALAPPPNKDSSNVARLVFFDPPYSKGEACRSPALFAEGGWMERGALVVFQCAGGEGKPCWGGDFSTLGVLSTSSADFFFFRYGS